MNKSAPPKKEPETPKVHFDPTFREAVAAGSLTAGQAYSRGNREAYAARLIELRGLSQESAYAVADNRVSLAEAMQGAASPTSFESLSVETRSRGRSRKLVWVGVMLPALVFAGWYAMRDGPVAPARPAGGLSAQSGVVTDGTGRLVRVIGSNPEAVLATFCTRTVDRRLEALGVMAPNSDGAPVRIGVLKDRAAPDRLLAIPIREDRRTGRWFSGDGHHPLVPESAPPGALEATPLRR